MAILRPYIDGIMGRNWFNLLYTSSYLNIVKIKYNFICEAANIEAIEGNLHPANIIYAKICMCVGVNVCYHIYP